MMTNAQPYNTRVRSLIIGTLYHEDSNAQDEVDKKGL